MTNFKFQKVCLQAVWLLKAKAPIDTGNLRNNAIRYKFENNKCIIYVDQKVAPYMVYTNEPWISPRWNGKKNPNEKWFDNATKHIVESLAETLHGSFKKRG